MSADDEPEAALASDGECNRDDRPAGARAMRYVSNQVIDLIEHCIVQPSSAEVGLAFFEKLRTFGAMAIYARSYDSPDRTEREQVFARSAPPDFAAMYSDPRFYECNPLPREARRSTGPMLFSELPWQGSRERWLWRSMRDCGFSDGLAVPCHGPQNYLGLVSIGFERMDGIGPADRMAIEISSYVLHGRMRSLSRSLPAPHRPSLTPRERDCLAFVAEGRSNAHIAHALGISTATVATHMAHVRAKLGAKTRSQAVAQFLAGAVGR